VWQGRSSTSIENIVYRLNSFYMIDDGAKCNNSTATCHDSNALEQVCVLLPNVVQPIDGRWRSSGEPVSCSRRIVLPCDGNNFVRTSVFVVSAECSGLGVLILK